MLVLELPHVHSATLAVMVRGGPRFETESEQGISHLVEHLVLRGTGAHPNSKSYHIAVETLGGEINGLTQRDATTIHMTVPARHAAPGLRLLAEAVIDPTLDGLDVEREVVIEEILDTCDARGRELDIDTLSRRALWAHPIGFPIAGEPEIIEGLGIDACRGWFRRMFAAENGVLIAAGRVRADEIVAEAARAFAAMPRGEPLPDAPVPIPELGLPIQVQPSDDSQTSILLSYPAPHENDPRFPALLLLRRILDDGFGSRLRQTICEQGGLAYSMAVSIDAYRDAGCIDVEITCAEPKLAEAVRATLGVLSGLGDLGEAELERAKTRHLADLEIALDDPSEMAGWYGGSVLLGREVGYEDWVAEAMRVTASDVTALARSIFTSDACLLTLVGPAGDGGVRALEAMLGRAPGSTVWIGEDD